MSRAHEIQPRIDTNLLDRIHRIDRIFQPQNEVKGRGWGGGAFVQSPRRLLRSRRLVRATTDQRSPLSEPPIASLSTCLNLPLVPLPPCFQSAVQFSGIQLRDERRRVTRQASRGRSSVRERHRSGRGDAEAQRVVGASLLELPFREPFAKSMFLKQTIEPLPHETGRRQEGLLAELVLDSPSLNADGRKIFSLQHMRRHAFVVK